MFRKILMFALVLAASGSAQAVDTATQVVHKALAALAPGASITHVGPAPMPGFYQALVQGRTVYVSRDGKYVMAGTLFDARADRNLTEDHMDKVRLEALATIPAHDRMIYAPSHPRYTVTVFTDLDCAYCRVFHRQIAAYNAEGIAVQYLFWPRSGLKTVPSGRDTPSYAKAVSVWCAGNAAARRKAFDAAKAGVSIPVAKCPNPVAREYHLGERIGVDGTPTIIASDGSVLGGYLSPPQLLQAVRMVKARQDAEAPGVDPSAAMQR